MDTSSDSRGRSLSFQDFKRGRLESLTTHNPSFSGDDIRALQEEYDERSSKKSSRVRRALMTAGVCMFGAAAFTAGYFLSPQEQAQSDVGSSETSPEDKLYAMVQSNVQLAASDTIYSMQKLAPALEAYMDSGAVPSDVPEAFLEELAKIAPPRSTGRLLRGEHSLEKYGSLLEEINNDRELQSSAKDLMNKVYSYVVNGVQNMPRVVTYKDDIMGIAREGTSCYIMAKETDSAGDWWNNLTLGIIDVLNVSPNSGGGYGSSVRGFKGFAQEYNAMRLQMWSYIQSECINNGATKFNFGGYSRGAAITTIAAAALVREGRLSASSVRVANYGSPRALSKASSDQVHGKYLEEYRVTYKGDPVPSLPYGWMGAKHQGYHRCYDCNYTAGRDRPGFGWPTDAGDHGRYNNVFPASSFSSSKSHQNA